MVVRCLSPRFSSLAIKKLRCFQQAANQDLSTSVHAPFLHPPCSFRPIVHARPAVDSSFPKAKVFCPRSKSMSRCSVGPGRFTSGLVDIPLRESAFPSADEWRSGTPVYLS